MQESTVSTALTKPPTHAHARSLLRPIMRVAIVDQTDAAPPLVQQLIEATDWCQCRTVGSKDVERANFNRAYDAAVLIDRGTGDPAASGPRYAEQEWHLELLRRHRVGVLILSNRPWLFAGYGFGTVCLPPDASLDKVEGVLLALARSRAVMRLIDKQVDSIRRLSETLSKQFEETQSELRLASKLQREFLPKELPQTGRVRFATLFHPCTWVSGDIFDVFRLDERHVGLYLADAVGHGVASGLLTMYIKHAIRTKRILENGYELIQPASVLSMLNDQLAAQALRDSQFITGWYGMIETQSLKLDYAVAGHPPPLLIRSDGRIQELRGEGCVLGLIPGQGFTDESVQLQSGDRVLVYSDGIEPVLITNRRPMPQLPELAPGLNDWLRLPADDLLSRLRSRLDSSPGSLSHSDDVSVVLMDVT